MDYEGFKTEIKRLSDINLSLYKERQMKRRIDSLISKNGYNSYSEYVEALKRNKELYSEFMDYLTINVSEFYRNPEQWIVLDNEILPRLLENNKKLKVWSAACSTGEEPYTLVMVLARHIPLRDIKIIASDIDEAALDKAREGKYNAKSLEKLPEEFRLKYFNQNGDTYSVKEEIKCRVDFVKHNLLKDTYPDMCDLIVCRNVLIYFTEEAKAYVYEHFNKALKNGGLLFIGSTEQITSCAKYSFKPLKTFYYTKEGEMKI